MDLGQSSAEYVKARASLLPDAGLFQTKFPLPLVDELLDEIKHTG